MSLQIIRLAYWQSLRKRLGIAILTVYRDVDHITEFWVLWRGLASVLPQSTPAHYMISVNERFSNNRSLDASRMCADPTQYGILFGAVLSRYSHAQGSFIAELSYIVCRCSFMRCLYPSMFWFRWKDGAHNQCDWVISEKRIKVSLILLSIALSHY